jgi:hypothetical protein
VGDRRLAREAPEVVGPHGLKPWATPQSSEVPAADVRLPLRGLQRLPLYGGPTVSLGRRNLGSGCPVRVR